MPKTIIDISLVSIFRVVGVGLLLLFLFAVKDLLILLLFALVLASAITPLVNWFEDHGVPRVISLLAVVALLIALIALIGITIVPHLIREFAGLARDFPTYWGVITTEFGKLGLLENEIVSEGVQGVLDSITVFFGRGLSSFSAILFGVFGGIIATVVAVLSTFYLALDRNGVEKFLRLFTPDEEETYVVDLWRRAQKKIGEWARGQLILMVFIGSVTFVVLTLLKVPFALVLAMLAMLLEVVPYVGPIVAGAVAVLISFFVSPLLALIVALAYVVIQQLESQVVVPLLYRKILRLHPVIVIFALIVGARFGGVAGIILAIPLTTVITEFLTDYAQGKIK